MAKKPINYFKTSNSAIEIKELSCPACRGSFYELDSRELDDCPMCDHKFTEAPFELAYDTETFTLIVDPMTGVPSVIKNVEYEPVPREVPTDVHDNR